MYKKKLQENIINIYIKLSLSPFQKTAPVGIIIRPRQGGGGEDERKSRTDPRCILYTSKIILTILNAPALTPPGVTYEVFLRILKNISKKKILNLKKIS